MASLSGLPNWYLSTPPCAYLFRCILATLIIRAIVFAFRAAAVTKGDFPNDEKDPQPGKNWSFEHAFWECFKRFSESKAHADLWLNAIIGFAGLAGYPVLMKTGYLSAVGGWLALRTAGNWGGWKISRTSFNRFLVSNLLELGTAYFWLTRFVQVR